MALCRQVGGSSGPSLPLVLASLTCRLTCKCCHFRPRCVRLLRAYRVRRDQSTVAVACTGLRMCVPRRKQSDASVSHHLTVPCMHQMARRYLRCKR